MLSKYMQDLSQIYFGVAKGVLKYLAGTMEYGILHKPGEAAILIGYTDSDWARCHDDIKSTSTYIFSLGSGVCSWSSTEQKTKGVVSNCRSKICCSNSSNVATKNSCRYWRKARLCNYFIL